MGAQASLMSADRQEKAEEIERSMIAHFQSEYLAEYRAQLMAVRTHTRDTPSSMRLVTD
jgi:hypothetical protein